MAAARESRNAPRNTFKIARAAWITPRNSGQVSFNGGWLIASRR